MSNPDPLSHPHRLGPQRRVLAAIGLRPRAKTRVAAGANPAPPRRPRRPGPRRRVLAARGLPARTGDRVRQLDPARLSPSAGSAASGPRSARSPTTDREGGGANPAPPRRPRRLGLRRRVLAARGLPARTGDRVRQLGPARLSPSAGSAASCPRSDRSPAPTGRRVEPIRLRPALPVGWVHDVASYRREAFLAGRPVGLRRLAF